MSKKMIIVVCIVLVIVIAALYGWHEYNRTFTGLQDAKADYSVSATALIKEFTANEEAANKKYLNRILLVQGMVKGIERSGAAGIVVLGDTTDMSSVRCVLDSTQDSINPTLQRGNAVTIKGAITGFKKDETGLLGSDVELNRCVVAN